MRQTLNHCGKKDSNKKTEIVGLEQLVKNLGVI